MLFFAFEGLFRYGLTVSADDRLALVSSVCETLICLALASSDFAQASQELASLAPFRKTQDLKG